MEINRKELRTRQKVILLLCKDLVHYNLKNQDVETRIAYKEGRAEFKKVQKRTIKGLKRQSSCLGRRLKMLGLFNLDAR